MLSMLSARYIKKRSWKVNIVILPIDFFNEVFRTDRCISSKKRLFSSQMSSFSWQEKKIQTNPETNTFSFSAEESKF